MKIDSDNSREIREELSFYENFEEVFFEKEPKGISLGTSGTKEQKRQKRKLIQKYLAGQLRVHQSTVSLRLKKIRTNFTDFDGAQS